MKAADEGEQERQALRTAVRCLGCIVQKLAAKLAPFGWAAEYQRELEELKKALNILNGGPR